MIQEANAVVAQQNAEFNDLRSELQVMESRNYAEKRDIERIEGDLRDATGLSHKYYGDIQRLKEAINARDLEIRGFKLRAEQLEGELEQSQRRIAVLNEARETKDSELASVHVKSGQENHQLS